MTALVSVVVIGRNEGEHLRNCLRSVQAADRPAGEELEVVYVDSGSADHSIEIAQTFGVKIIALQPAEPTAALARNAGWRSAQGRYILFLDGDTALHPAFLTKALDAMRDRSAGIVWGHRRERQPYRSIYARVLDLDWIYGPGDTEFCGGDALVRRDALELTGGFDPGLMAGEEPELCRRLRAAGRRIVHIDEPMTTHDLGMKSWRQYWRRAVRAGFAYAEVSNRFKGSGMPFWERESRQNRHRAIALIAMLLGGLGSAAWLVSPWPLALGVSCFLLLALRTGFKARWKGGSLSTLFLYGVHSHLQQIPIGAGQLKHWRGQTAGQPRTLVDYKDGRA